MGHEHSWRWWYVVILGALLPVMLTAFKGIAPKGEATQLLGGVCRVHTCVSTSPGFEIEHEGACSIHMACIGAKARIGLQWSTSKLHGNFVHACIKK